MKAIELLTVLDEQDRDNKVWLFTLPMFRILFPQESDNALKMSLRRHCEVWAAEEGHKGTLCQRTGELLVGGQATRAGALAATL